MKRSDLIFVAFVLILFVPFFVSEPLYALFLQMTGAHPYLMAFVKFAVLATAGEMIGLRIKNGVYNHHGFGVVPRAVVWGILGVWIAIAMKTFSVGAPALLESFGAEGIRDAMKGGFTVQKLCGAFAISVMMNTTFAPVFMTCHKITDTHILSTGGTLRGFFTPLPFGATLASLNWGVMWGFVFRKTIPLFWIPAHTITFLLPQSLQVLFAALLGVALGVILSVAAIRSRVPVAAVDAAEE